MKKDRNSFFSEYNMNAYNSVPVQQPVMPMNMLPNQVSSQSSFYSGPAYDASMMQSSMNQSNQNTYTQDIESRLSKIERQINRIDTRLNKLESELNNNYSIQSESDIYKNNNMYMV